MATSTNSPMGLNERLAAIDAQGEGRDSYRNRNLWQTDPGLAEILAVERSAKRAAGQTGLREGTIKFDIYVDEYMKADAEYHRLVSEARSAGFA